MTKADAPAPLIPGEVDLRDFPFMPLDVRRLRDSRLVAVRTAEEVLAAILLWAASWHQQPAASLPDDDIELSQLAGYGRSVKEFKRVKDGALHALILCSDGRWYHPVVAEKAADAWNGRLELEWRRAVDRTRKENKERAERKEEAVPIPVKPTLLSVRLVNGIPTYRAWNSDGSQTNSEGIPAPVCAGAGVGAPAFERERGKGQEKGKGERDFKSPVSQPAAASISSPDLSTKGNGAAAAELIFPPKFSAAQCDAAAPLFNGNSNPQVVLDELQGVMERENVRDPVAMLVSLLRQQREGTFVPSHAHRIEAQREGESVRREVKTAEAEGRA